MAPHHLQLYPKVVDAHGEGIPPRLIKTDRRETGREGAPWMMFARTPSEGPIRTCLYFVRAS
jgi:hypothetical protein